MSIRFPNTSGQVVSYSIPFVGDQTTVMLRFNAIVDKDDYATIVSMNNNDDFQVTFFLDSNGTRTSLYQPFFSVDGPDITIGQWYHLAIVRSGEDSYVYLGGSLIITHNGSYYNWEEVSLGNDYWDTTFDGAICDVMAFNEAWPIKQIKNQVKKRRPITTNNMMLWVPALEKGSGRSRDYSSYNRTPILSGTLTDYSDPKVPWGAGGAPSAPNNLAKAYDGSVTLGNSRALSNTTSLIASASLSLLSASGVAEGSGAAYNSGLTLAKLASLLAASGLSAGGALALTENLGVSGSGSSAVGGALALGSLNSLANGSELEARAMLSLLLSLSQTQANTASLQESIQTAAVLQASFNPHTATSLVLETLESVLGVGGVAVSSVLASLQLGVTRAVGTAPSYAMAGALGLSVSLSLTAEGEMDESQLEVEITLHNAFQLAVLPSAGVEREIELTLSLQTGLSALQSAFSSLVLPVTVLYTGDARQDAFAALSVSLLLAQALGSQAQAADELTLGQLRQAALLAQQLVLVELLQALAQGVGFTSITFAVDTEVADCRIIEVAAEIRYVEVEPETRIIEMEPETRVVEMEPEYRAVEMEPEFRFVEIECD